MPEAFWFESRCQFVLVEPGVVALLGLGRRDVADGLHQPAIVEPVDPFEGRELDGFERPPRPAPMNDLGLVKSVDGLGQSIAVAVADAGLLTARYRRRPGARYI